MKYNYVPKINSSMEKLPFELHKYHKYFTKCQWKKRGLITDEFEAIYEKYIYSTNCELCGEVYKSRNDRQMDHDHDTGKFRNVCCRSCNLRKRDVKIRTDNKSGHKYIYKSKDSRCKQGFIWGFTVQIDRKRKTLKESVDLEKVIQFRDKWLEENNYQT